MKTLIVTFEIISLTLAFASGGALDSLLGGLIGPINVKDPKIDPQVSGSDIMLKLTGPILLIQSSKIQP